MNTLIVALALVAGALGATEVPKHPLNYLHHPVQFYPAAHYPHNFHYPQNFHYRHFQPYAQVQYVQPKYVEPQHVATARTAPIAIVRHSAESGIGGSFSYDYETQNGILARAAGSVKNFGSKDEAQVMEGSYSYTSPEGIPISTNWVADEFGFRAEGAHLPTPPPIPEAIARSLEYNKAHPSETVVESA